MLDVIDERNRKAKLAKMVIKRRNVIYQSPVQNEKTMERTKMVQDVLTRLELERKEEEEKKQMEIESLIEENERKLREVNRILNEKQEFLERTMRSAAIQETTLEEAVREKVVEEALLAGNSTVI